MFMSEEKFQELQRLARLRDDAIVSNEEFEKLKAQILGNELSSPKDASISPPDNGVGTRGDYDRGWWRASDGLWYPPESHPDPDHRQRWTETSTLTPHQTSVAPMVSRSPNEQTEVGKVCLGCGALGVTSKDFCPHCGVKYGNKSETGQTSNEALAIMASIFAVIGFFFFPIIFSTVGIILGGIAWARGSQRGRLACIFSIISLVLGMLLGLFVFASF